MTDNFPYAHIRMQWRSCQRRYRHDLLPWQAKRFPACHEYAHIGAGIEDAGDDRRSGKHVLEVVQDQQSRLCSQVSPEPLQQGW